MKKKNAIRDARADHVYNVINSYQPVYSFKAG